ncbi:unnamed protein product [Leptosia nina]|uniref:Shugoshin C-terminal domain-containing protein n=1 Tax=Leptosia nina TaxID=320188 RepID=A0AAV1JKY1_9NEOP
MNMTDTLEIENNCLREKNNELAQEIQHWKMAAADKDSERLSLLKKISQLKLQLSMLRNRGDSRAQQLESAIQLSAESVLSHLVQSSNEVAHIIEVMKGYMQDRREIDSSSPQWTINSRSSDKVHKVLPTLMGGRSIQPVVSLSRTLPNSNGGETHSSEMPLPMRALQELYIPLTRIDAAETSQNSYNLDDSHSTDNLDLNDESTAPEEEMNDTVSENQETRNLGVVKEEDEETQCSSRSSRDENPLEGPSWLLDASPSRSNDNIGRSPRAFTPTVRRKNIRPRPEPPCSPVLIPTFMKKNKENGPVLKVLVAKMKLKYEDNNSDVLSLRKRSMEDKVTIKPRDSPQSGGDAVPANSKDSRLPESHNIPQDPSQEYRLYRNDSHEPKRRKPPGPPAMYCVPIETPNGGTADEIKFDAPSPNGATGRSFIVQDTAQPGTSGLNRFAVSSRDSQARRPSHHSHSDTVSDTDSEIPETRSRRPRKNVVYKEKPLNRKMRR